MDVLKMDSFLIRRCDSTDLENILEIINDGAQAYKGVIPPDYWKEPYMSGEELRNELDEGIVLWGYEEKGALISVMGIQDKQDVTLVRHAYVLTSRQNLGIGGRLLHYLLQLTGKPVLVATWRNADWAIRFYEGHGFRLVPEEDGYSLQKKYWSTPEKKIKASVVLADERWFDLNKSNAKV
jgi:GNAT superfamily N-acetyltransferase